MTSLSHTLRRMALVAASGLWLAGSAVAAEPHGADHDATEAASHEAAAEQGGEHGAAHEGDHGAAHGGHGPVYTADDDHDGTANWMDADSDHFVLGGVGWHAINFALFVGLLWWFALPPLRDLAHSRSVTIRTDLDEAQSLRDEAARRHTEITDRLAALEAELSAIEGRAEAEAASESARIEERAKAAAAALKETVERQIRDEAARARQALRAEAVEIAVELAEGILKERVGADDQKALASAFLDTVRASEEGPHA